MREGTLGIRDIAQRRAQPAALQPALGSCPMLQRLVDERQGLFEQITQRAALRQAQVGILPVQGRDGLGAVAGRVVALFDGPGQGEEPAIQFAFDGIQHRVCEQADIVAGIHQPLA